MHELFNGKTPDKFGYTVIVHKSSLKDFKEKLQKQVPQLVITGERQVKIHYIFIELREKEGTGEFNTELLYKLPLMCLREELTRVIFTKKYSTFKKMANILYKDEEDISFHLLADMLTGYEKSVIMDLPNCEGEIKLFIIHDPYNSNLTEEKTYFGENKKVPTSELFEAEVIKQDNKEVDFIQTLQNEEVILGIC